MFFSEVLLTPPTKLHLPWVTLAPGMYWYSLRWAVLAGHIPDTAQREGNCLHPEQPGTLNRQTAIENWWGRWGIANLCSKTTRSKEQIEHHTKMHFRRACHTWTEALQSHIAADKVHFTAKDLTKTLKNTKPAGWSELCTLPLNVRGVCTTFTIFEELWILIHNRALTCSLY